MKVLYVFPEDLPLPHARGVQVAHTLGSLLELGLDVFLAYTPSRPIVDPLDSYGIQGARSLHRLELSRRAPGLLCALPIKSNRFFNYKIIKWLRKQVHVDAAPDVIMIRHLKTAHALIKAGLGIPIVYEAHEIFALTARPRLRRKFASMERQVLQNAARVITISQNLAKEINEYYGIQRQYDILHSGTDIAGTPSQKNWSDCANRVIYTGSLHAWKGVSDLVAAGRWLPGFRILVIGGNAEQIERLRQEVADEGADVEFKSHADRDQIRIALADACIAVLPNRSQSISAWTSPIKLFEYMGAGCAIVASDLDTVREVLDETDAVFVPPDQPRLLAQAIADVADNPARARDMGERVRKKAEGFTWRARGQKLAGILSTVSGTR